jgi:lipid II:glycine glycyltransferase (peptidoglycan interpeptide bridge formation enzyme)
MRHVLEEFPMTARTVVIYKEAQPMACSLIVGFKDTLENPWVSANRKYNKFGPNIFLYWTMMEFARDAGLTYFEFGRSSPGEGTYNFKKQWGAKPVPLHWTYISLNDQPINETVSEKSKFEKAIRIWKKLPVSVTKVIGPRIRKYIGL